MSPKLKENLMCEKGGLHKKSDAINDMYYLYLLYILTAFSQNFICKLVNY